MRRGHWADTSVPCLRQRKEAEMHQAARTGSKGSASDRQSRRRRTKAPVVPMLVAPGVETEALLRSTLDSLSAHVAVLDATGTIIAVNKAWRLFAKQSGYVGDDDGVGTNYLASAKVAHPCRETQPQPPKHCGTSWQAVAASSAWRTRAPGPTDLAGFSFGSPARNRRRHRGSSSLTRTSPRSSVRRRSSRA